MVTRRLGELAVLVLVAVACSADPPDPGATASEDTSRTTTISASTTTTRPRVPHYTSEVYADDDHWLCLPGRAGDACDVDLARTRIDRDGRRTVEAIEPATDPPIDCFYVYPTVSTAPTPNSGLVPTDAEVRVVRVQAAPLRASCRLYAPMYRQITLSALVGEADGIADRGLAFGDVVDAWRHYLANHNDGRGVVLIGHSQGAGHLRELIARHLDHDDDGRGRLVSAILLGTTVRTPRDATVGSHFDNIAPCRSPDDTGCVISYSAYAADAPPGEGGFFAGVRDAPHERAVCTNPAALGGGAARLDSILAAAADRDGRVETHWVRYVGIAEAACVEEGDHHYLSIRYTSTPDDVWPDDLGGRLSPPWGLHLIDVNLALGDLTELVAHQGRVHDHTS